MHIHSSMVISAVQCNVNTDVNCNCRQGVGSSRHTIVIWQLWCTLKRVINSRITFPAANLCFQVAPAVALGFFSLDRACFCVIFSVYGCMLCLVHYLLVISSSVIDCLGRFVPEMTYYVSSGTLNLAQLQLRSSTMQLMWCHSFESHLLQKSAITILFDFAKRSRS